MINKSTLLVCTGLGMSVKIRKTATKHDRLVLASLGGLAVLLLLGASIVAPTLSAYADNGNHKSQDDKKGHQKDRKGDVPKDPERCLHGASAKYNKHCTLD